MREITVGNFNWVDEIAVWGMPVVGCVTKLNVLITTQKAVTSKIAL